VVKRTRLSADFGLDDFRAIHDRERAPALPLFLIGADGTVEIARADEPLEPGDGDSLVALVTPAGE
jgi:hypothetical protein